LLLTLLHFQITLHHPMEVPRGRQKYFRVALNQAVIAAVKPIMMTTSKELKNYNPEDRNCYFIKEKSLKFFTIYNQPNCLYECLTEFTLENCECVGFHMQRENSTPMCSPYKERCVVDARASYLASEVNKKIQYLREMSKLKRESKFTKKRDCHCLPTCTTLDFDVETSLADWDWKTFLEVERLSDDWKEENDILLQSGSHVSRLLLYFKDMQFLTQERNELYGQTDFWANCGGLLGLFTGFSFISALDIFYYLTLRFICNLYKFGKDYWSGSEELLERKKKNDNSTFS
ncbi:hypothetical protein ILUMI_14722, partial [Ignelater luminosus]